MLKHLYIRHFTIIDEVALDLSPGLTVLTGETGAGKSILIDALQIVLGERAENGSIKTGEARCEVAAMFDLRNHLVAQEWLKVQEMDEGEECIIRRILTNDGRSRATINARPCSLQVMREFAALLVHVHGQNQHQQLLKNDYQRDLLDDYAQNSILCDAVYKVHRRWHEATVELAKMNAQDASNQKAFLEFQLRELEDLNLQANELVELVEEHQRLAHAEQWISTYQQALEILSDAEQHSVLHGLHTADALLRNVAQVSPSVSELLQQAVIQTEEAATQIRQQLKTLEPDPERMQWIEQRLACIHDIARKHRVAPEELFSLQQNLQSQFQLLDQRDTHILLCEEKIKNLVVEYRLHTKQLSQRRLEAAQKLSADVSAQIQILGMPNGRIEIQLSAYETDELQAHGDERVEFLVSTNVGQPCYGLKKVASGGELSRIALAIQVVTARAAVLPTLIFDEVDVGIGGGVAEIVGQQLKQLGGHAQVLCVTHLPQVAVQGHQHLHVQKQTQNEKVVTGIRLLSSEEKIQEIARMLGGVKITEKTLAHAREMLDH